MQAPLGRFNFRNAAGNLPTQVTAIIDGSEAMARLSPNAESACKRYMDFSLPETCGENGK